MSQGVHPYEGPGDHFDFGTTTSQDSYVTCGSQVVSRYKRKTVVAQHLDANSNALDWRIQGTMRDDPSSGDWFTIHESTGLAAAAVEYHSFNDVVKEIRVQVKANAGGSQDDLQVDVGGYDEGSE